MLRQAAPPAPRPKRPAVPRFWVMTDRRIGAATIRIAARTLPPRSAIVIRPHALNQRGLNRLVVKLRRIAAARRHLLLWGGPGNPPGFGGRHLRGAAKPGRGFVSRPVHNRVEAQRARRLPSDAVLISPVFPTRSHPGATTLTRRGFAMLAARTRRPAIALGGVTAAKYRQLRYSCAAGWAAIDGWLAENR